MPRISVVVPGREPPSDRWHEAMSRQRVDNLEVLAGSDPADAVGDYLVLLRPEDEVVPLGLLMLLSSLDASCADTELGTGGTGPGSVAALSTARTGTTAHQLPALLEHANLSATLWRRSFWDAHVRGAKSRSGAWPGGSRPRPGRYRRCSRIDPDVWRSLWCGRSSTSRWAPWLS